MKCDLYHSRTIRFEVSLQSGGCWKKEGLDPERKNEYSYIAIQGKKFQEVC